MKNSQSSSSPSSRRNYLPIGSISICTRKQSIVSISDCLSTWALRRTPGKDRIADHPLIIPSRIISSSSKSNWKSISAFVLHECY